MCSLSFPSDRLFPSLCSQRRHMWGSGQGKSWQERLEGRATTLVARLVSNLDTECFVRKWLCTSFRLSRVEGGWQAIHWKLSDFEEFICKSSGELEWWKAAKLWTIRYNNMAFINELEVIRELDNDGKAVFDGLDPIERWTPFYKLIWMITYLWGTMLWLITNQYCEFQRILKGRGKLKKRFLSGIAQGSLKVVILVYPCR